MVDSLVQHQQEHFDKIAREYHEARDNPRSDLLKKNIWKAAFRNARLWNLSDPVKVLEAMCGSADGYKILQDNLRLDFEYHGFDYSKEMIHYAQKKYPFLSFSIQDVTSYISEETYDLIILIGGLHHVYSNVDRAIRNLSGVLKKGGIFINFEPTNNNYFLKKIRSSIYKNNALFDDSTEKAFETPELRRLFLNHDLKAIDTLYPGLLAYILWYNPDAFPFLNHGYLKMVSLLSSLEDRCLWRTCLAYYMSFATLTIYKKI
ncbi:MAG: methyltransferase domain-containing protein [Synergistaceae bacterium]|jgi:ubiquinone/menaquinone biosynthesis C-methylase UbiE|nr:methyltransferase domain-containing protein [Synergistaceae bacterium]